MMLIIVSISSREITAQTLEINGFYGWQRMEQPDFTAAC